MVLYTLNTQKTQITSCHLKEIKLHIIFEQKVAVSGNLRFDSENIDLRQKSWKCVLDYFYQTTMKLSVIIEDSQLFIRLSIILNP